ncbi:MAG: segregation/condensation protein A [Deltaproteobacteria bacterium]|jgi:segregation and condensation protein A|nr:segregation/condensation protein A [Deltaproteobacteria bacterium]
MPDSLHITLEVQDGIYEGPLDLLLHLIDKNKVDINDIPMSLITGQYLEYLDLMDRTDLDAAGDFLVMAATLTNIKSRLLLPRLEIEGQPAEDPREELTGPLLEYAQMKSVAQVLDQRPVLNRDVFTRGENEEAGDISFIDNRIQSTLFDLIQAWHELASRQEKEETLLQFKIETKTIGQRLAEIRAYLLEIKSSNFRELVRQSQNALEVALSFLAILELARTGFLRLYQQTETDFTGPRMWLADPEAKTLEPEQLDYR